MKMSKKDYRWIVEAINYDNAASVGAACAKLMEFRRGVYNDFLTIPTNPPCKISNTKEFDEWVHRQFPGMERFPDN